MSGFKTKLTQKGKEIRKTNDQFAKQSKGSATEMLENGVHNRKPLKGAKVVESKSEANTKGWK